MATQRCLTPIAGRGWRRNLDRALEQSPYLRKVMRGACPGCLPKFAELLLHVGLVPYDPRDDDSGQRLRVVKGGRANGGA